MIGHANDNGIDVFAVEEAAIVGVGVDFLVLQLIRLVGVDLVPVDIADGGDVRVLLFEVRDDSTLTSQIRCDGVIPFR
jgi:hypothetical protein